MVRAYSGEFRRDVIAIARKGEASVRQVARDFGVSESCLARWPRLADRGPQHQRGRGAAGQSGRAGGAAGRAEPDPAP
ncbi:transposase [Curtobacterium sp. YC1]|uniref:transposase n=1 Tax=Curtobacterium sp. YC1 TaxID=2795488 RepID=UPI0018E51CFB|nr:transposase [Curtobacterium sp. YC1]